MRKTTDIASQFELVSGYCGKNLFDKNNIANLLSGTIKSNGMFVSGSEYSFIIECLPNTTYTLSKVATILGSGATFSEYPENGSIGRNILWGGTITTRTFTTEANDKYIVIAYCNNVGESLTPEEIRNTIQLELGSTATPYEPYDSTKLQYRNPKGGYFPFETPQLTGKNLLNINREVAAERTYVDDSVMLFGVSRNNGYNNNFISQWNITNNVITLTSTNAWYGIGFPVRVTPNTRYYISADKSENATTGVGFYTENGEYIDNAYLSYFTTPENCYWANVCMLPTVSNTQVSFSKVQLEKSSVPTAYEPYAPGITEEALQEWRESKWNSGIEKEYGLRVVGKTHQDSKTGKNLFDKSKSTIRGIRDEIVCQDWAGMALSNDEVKKLFAPNTTYTFSFDYTLVEVPISGTPGTCRFGFLLYSTSYPGNVNIIDDSWESVGTTTHITRTFITPNNLDTFNLLLYTGEYNNPWANCKARFFNIQIELGSVETPYEPYCGGIPAPNPEYPMEIQCVKAGTEIKVYGKNLVIFEEIRASSYSVYISTKTVTAINKLPKNRLYYCKYDVESDGSGGLIGRSYLHIIYTDNTTSDFAYDSVNPIDIFNGGKNILNILMYGANTGMTYNLFKNFIITDEKDSPTPYEPYIGTTITTPCDLYEGDIWYPMSGKVEKYKKIRRLYPTDDWNVYDSQYGRVGVLINDMRTGSFNIQEGYCTIMGIGDANKWTCRLPSCYFGISNKLFYILLGYSATIEQFKEKIGEYIDIVYTLATPIIEQYPPQPICIPTSVPSFAIVDGVTTQTGTPSPDNPIEIGCIREGDQVSVFEDGKFIGIAIAPCNLYEGDKWCPTTGDVERNSLELPLLAGSLQSINAYDIANYQILGTDIKSAPRGPLLNTHFPNQITSIANTKTEGILLAEGNCAYIRLHRSKGETVVEVNKYLSNLNGYLVCKRSSPITEHYDPQVISKPLTIANVLQQPVDLPADLSASMLVKRLPS